jgi:hypothetical protein
MAEQTKSRVRLNEVRIGYPNLFTPKKPENGEGEAKYSAAFYLDKKANAKDIAVLNAQIAAVKAASKLAKHKFPANMVFLKEVPEDKIDDEGLITGTDIVAANTLMFNASNKRKPGVVDRDHSRPLTAEDDKIIAGCYVNVSVTPWVQDNKFGKRINASLEAVQYVGKGPSTFGAPPVDPEEEFSNIEDDDNPAG